MKPSQTTNESAIENLRISNKTHANERQNRDKPKTQDEKKHGLRNTITVGDQCCRRQRRARVRRRDFQDCDNGIDDKAGLSAGRSHELSESGYPFHLMRDSIRFRPRRASRIYSISKYSWAYLTWGRRRKWGRRMRGKGRLLVLFEESDTENSVDMAFVAIDPTCAPWF